jgi:hypothetical protein
MLDLPATQNRVRAMLDDPSGGRFSDTLLETAIRHALAGVDVRLPQVVRLDVAVQISGRDQTLQGLAGCRHLVELLLVGENTLDTRGEPAEYTYTLTGETLDLHFSGGRVPQNGERMKLTYAARHTLAGLDSALTTSLPDAAEVALDYGSAGHACLLRSASMAESYAARPGESSRLLDQAKIWLERFDHALVALAAFQEFGFPPGFNLDVWDRKGS